MATQAENGKARGRALPQKGGDERTLDRQVADAVMEDIIAWRIPPGSWIRERQIAQRFDVSHGPVREAFRHLSQAGFINVVPWRGAHVIEMTPHTVHEIYTLWSSLFSVICRLAAERIGNEDLPRLEELAADYEKCVRATNDTNAHFTSSQVLGQFISSRAQGPLARSMIDRATLLARWAHHLALDEPVAKLQPSLGLSSAALCRVMVEAIKARNPDEAERAARELINFTERHVAQAVKARVSEQPAVKPRRRRTAPTSD